MSRLDVGVVGGGFAGAAAALFLAERGHVVTVYEEAARPEPVGAGILLQPSGLSVLADLGLLPAAVARGSRVEGLRCCTPSGRVVLELSYRDLFEGWFGLGLHRGALFELLHAQLPARGVKLVTSAQVWGSRLVARGIRPILRDGSEPGQHQLLVVADGDRSQLRRRVTGASATPRVLALEPRAGALLAQIEEPSQLLPASYWDVKLPRFDQPRLVFIGDAAHATSPQLGQGTNLALEDARSLASCVSGCRDLADGLSLFDAERRRHAAYYQLASWGLTPFFQSDYSSLGALRDAWLGPLCRFPPTQRLMLRTLAGIQSGFWGSVRLGPLHARLSGKPI